MRTVVRRLPKKDGPLKKVFNPRRFAPFDERKGGFPGFFIFGFFGDIAAIENTILYTYDSRRI